MNKTDLLEYLKINQHQYISGEQIAAHFGISRAGVWKHIKNLQTDGVGIEGVTNKGYKLTQNYLTEREILQNLTNATFGNYSFSKITCETFESITSTNTYAKTHQTDGLHIIAASHQSEGRGRRGNSFYSPKNTGVYFTLAFEPNSNTTNIFTVAAAVALCEVLSLASGKNTLIKWVNDIYLQNKKISGILTEGTFDFESGKLSEVIVGMGVNLQTTNFPEDIKNKAGSLGVAINPNQLIADVAVKFFQTLALPNPEIIEKYTNLSMVIGKEVTFTQNGKEVTATATHFNSEGNLICRDAMCEIHTLKAGEISITGDFLQSAAK